MQRIILGLSTPLFFENRTPGRAMATVLTVTERRKFLLVIILLINPAKKYNSPSTDQGLYCNPKPRTIIIDLAVFVYSNDTSVENYIMLV
jgi:hypothetical protein